MVWFWKWETTLYFTFQYRPYIYEPACGEFEKLHLSRFKGIKWIPLSQKRKQFFNHNICYEENVYWTIMMKLIKKQHYVN